VSYRCHRTNLSLQQIIDLLALAEEYLLGHLKELCEVAAKELITNDECAKLLSAAERFNAPYLKEACVKYIVDNISDIVDKDSFRQEIEQYPTLAVVILKAHSSFNNYSPEPCAKRRRLNMPPVEELVEDFD
jgi:hypothetical protein